jgi:alkylation response protein AidB-like acyl-CoA dehydrogenase
VTFELPADRSADETLFVEVLDDLAARRLIDAGAAIDETGVIDPDIQTLLAEHGFLDPLAVEEVGAGEPDAGGAKPGGRLTLLLVERLARASVAVATIPARLGDARAAVPHPAVTPAGGRADDHPPLTPPQASRPVLVDGGPTPVSASIDGFGWRLDGAVARLEWVAEADRLVVIAVTDEGPAVFEVDPSTAGVELGAREATTGMLGVPVRGLHLDGARVIGGEPAGGARAAARARRHRALTGAAMAVALAAVGVEVAVAYAGQRRQFGRRLSEFGALRALIADMEARTLAASALLWSASGNTGDPLGGPGAFRAARVAVEAALSVTRDAVQVHGGYGYIRGHPVERLMRDAVSVAARTGRPFGLLEELAATLLPA